MTPFGRFLGAMAGACALGLLPAAGPARASIPSAPLGEWTTANGYGVVNIARCGDALCGRIVGIDRPPDAAMPTDVQGRPQCGLTIIIDATPTAGGTWEGRITDPRTGSTYQARLRVDDAGRLHVRGFLGIPLLGKTQVWQRFTGRLTAACGIA